MARPRKEGMEYFPHDTDARNDLKIRKLRAVFGNDGYATYFILLENIYRNKSYSIDVSGAETMLILAEECKISEEKLSQIILKCCDLDLFSKQLYQESNILTSEAIKKRTEPIENKRKKNNESYNTSKVEVSDAETNAEIDISDTEKGAESTQSKGKHSKEDNSIYIAQANQLWLMYPSKTGKAKVIDKLPKLIKKIGYEELVKCIERYKHDKEDWKQWQNGSTFFNSGYVDFLDENYVKPINTENGQQASKVVMFNFDED
jgi:hypothetical protein